MICSGPLEDIIKLTIYSAYVKKEKPVSLLIIAKPETGKTMSMKKFMKNKGLAFLTDATAYGIQRDLLSLIEKGEIRHILIPDLIKPLSRKGSTVSNFISFINALVEEGVVSISTYADRRTFEIPVRCGIIAAVIKEDLESKLDYWGTIGFMSRFIPFSYNYSIDVVQKIFEYIIKGEYRNEEFIRLKNLRDREISISPHLARKLIPIAQEIGRRQKFFGFRALRDLKVLAQASALERGKPRVCLYDINRIIKLSRWMNLDYNMLTEDV
jgi:hypothetical protein